MNDRNFLLWLRERMIHVYGVDAGTDYILKLGAIAAATPADRLTPGTFGPDVDLLDLAVERLAKQCRGKRDRECLFRLAKEVAIIDQNFESAVSLRTRQGENKPCRAPKGGA